MEQDMKKFILCTFLCLVALSFFMANGRAAAARDTPTHPVVLIPGILGSKLCDEAGAVLWGQSAKASLSNFHLLDINAQLPTKIKPCGIVDSVQVLGPFYSVAAYSNLIDAMTEWNLVEGQNLFIFDYDWRQSNIDNAIAFDQFVVSKLGRDKKFNIVAHSMGGSSRVSIAASVPTKDGNSNTSSLR